MAVPVVPVVVAAGHALKTAVQRWPFWLGLSLFVGVTAFSFSVFFNQITSSVLKLWPILALAGVFIMLRQVVKEYFKLRKKEAKNRRQ